MPYNVILENEIRVEIHRNNRAWADMVDEEEVVDSDNEVTSSGAAQPDTSAEGGSHEDTPSTPVELTKL